jgi:Endonuclease-reverse transcriptase
LCSSKPQSTAFRFGTFNARSIGNKFTSISTWITDDKPSIATISETWHSASDDPNLIACIPVDYCCIDRARPRSANRINDVSSNHGGVCLFHHRSVHVRSIQLPTYDSFEHLGVYAQSCGLNLLVIVIYRPGSENITNTFFDDFADLLERVAKHASPLLIVGDVNVHLDDETDSSTIKFQHLLAAHGLGQRVHVATHSGGHTLDVVITRDETQINLLHVDPPILSDHSFIIGQLESTTLIGVEHVLCVRRRRWQSFDIDEFSHDLQHKVSLLM